MQDSVGRVLVMISILASASVARGGPRQPRSVVDPGSGWHCVKIHAEFNPRDRAGGCFRTPEACERMRDTLREDQSAEPTIVGDCIAQKKAAVVTYFDTMQDASRFWASPSTELCQETRQSLERDPDNRRVSACQLVGDLPFPAGPFQAGRVEPGAGWYCSAGTQRAHACARTREACEAMGGTRCAPQPKAVAVTWTPSPEADEGLDRATGANWDGAAVFRSSGDCARFRALVSMRRSDMSPCTPVGAVGGPPVDRAKIAEGASEPAAAVAAYLDRAMISDGVNRVKPRILDCGLRFEARGTVKVSVRVGPDGRVQDVVLKTSPDPQLGACVGTAIREARFAPTRVGGSFGYPFVF